MKISIGGNYAALRTISIEIRPSKPGFGIPLKGAGFMQLIEFINFSLLQNSGTFKLFDRSEYLRLHLEDGVFQYPINSPQTRAVRHSFD